MGDFSGFDAKALQIFEDGIDRLCGGFVDSVSKWTARLETPADDAYQKNGLRSGSKHLGCQETLRERGGMRVEALRGHGAEDVILTEKVEGAGSGVSSDTVDEDDGVASGDAVGEIERGRAKIRDLDVIVEGVGRLQQSDDVGTDRVVAKQDVADAADEHVLHRIFATPILRPEGSNAWQAQAMQGSNEWTVRNTSSGSSGFASGVCRSEASYGPWAPARSRGLAFHVDGTTAW